MFPELTSTTRRKKSVRKIRVKEVLSRLEDSRVQYERLKPSKSSIVPGCKHCKDRLRTAFSGERQVFIVPRDKATFVKKLELFIDEGLRNVAKKESECGDAGCDHLSCGQKILDAELAVYRSAFDVLLEKITTFKPLLIGIKSIYDRCIEIRDERAKLMEILSSKLEGYKKSVERKIDAIERTGTAEVYALRNERNELIQTVTRLKHELDECNDKINTLRNELCENEEREIRRIVNNRQQVRLQVADQNSEPLEDRGAGQPSKGFADDPVLVNISLQRARKDLSSAHRKIAELEDTFREVVPKRDLERLENRHQAFEREFRNVSQELEALAKDHETLKLNFEVVNEQKNSLRDRCKILAHTNTPRPDWSKCGQFIQGGVQRWRDITAKKSSEDRLTILLSELCGVASAENNYFVGQGTDPSVPLFLRYKGKMKNRKLGRREVSILINDIWQNRVSSGDQNNLPMGDYILKYFTERYHLPLLRYEWIYNLYYACQRLVYDDQIGLFWDILWNNVAEDAYHVPRKELTVIKKMMEMRMEDKKIKKMLLFIYSLKFARIKKLAFQTVGLVRTCLKLDRMEKLACQTVGFVLDRLKNALLAQDIIEVMDTMYPYKTNRDIENIVYAAAKQLGIDPSTEAFDIAKLLAHNEEGWERGEFARELARQTAKEITEFGKAILRSINIQDKISEVGVETLKKGFMEVDEGISQTLLSQHLKWIYKVQDLSKAKPMVSSAIVRQMLNGYIRRSHPKTERRN